LERLVSEPHTRLRYFCSPQHTDSALYPITRQMERAAGFAHDDTAQAKLDKLDAVLAQTSTSKQDAALLADMLSLPNDGRYPTLELTPQQRRQKTLEALTAKLAGLASQHPVLMIFDDVHWIDPTSLEALNRTVDRIKTLPVLRRDRRSNGTAPSGNICVRTELNAIVLLYRARSCGAAD
jgi:predicted ATPase